MPMRKFISVNTSTNEEGGININIDVLENPMELLFTSCGGYLESSDLDDLYTPACIMLQQLIGQDDKELDENLVANVVGAFRMILTPAPTVSVNGVRFA